ncbi:DUF4097 family beta strand repeat-containing protein [uncultured Paludibaculum sp.]|uniref:DUF4097 family beta strand repeat-containing protein n=1 Tax=uncultured Paludibaculum sp. TaxID=1765020 RepID=UPI002D1E39B7|nr:DUF4097 family beta strand repeat-containing protein [uncultured Paludibaculum sp.]
MRRLLPIFVLAGLSGHAQESAWSSDRSGWTRTSTGSACQQATRLKVVTQGRLTVLSDDRHNVGFKWSCRTAGASQPEAERRLHSVRIQAQQQGGVCILVASAPDGPSVTSDLVVTIPRQVRQLYMESRNGSLSGKYLKGAVEAVTAAGNIEMDDIDGSVVARTGGGCLTFTTVTGSIRGLSGGGCIKVGKVGKEAVLESAGGEVLVEEAGSWLRLSTAGNIHVGRAAESVFAHTSAGLIEVEQSGGVVTAETGGGTIQIGSAKGVRCESAGGTIRLKSVSGALRAATASGNIYATLTSGLMIENSFLATSRGDITVSVPSKMPVTVKALNESSSWLGRVVSDFPEIQVQPSQVGRGRSVLAQGSLNGGGPVLMLSATNGAIILRRLK